MFFPCSTYFESPLSTIEILNELANENKTIITTHQLPIIDSSIRIETLLQHNKLNDNFNALKEGLKEQLSKNIGFLINVLKMILKRIYKLNNIQFYKLPMFASKAVWFKIIIGFTKICKVINE